MTNQLFQFGPVLPMYVFGVLRLFHGLRGPAIRGAILARGVMKKLRGRAFPGRDGHA